MKITFIKQFLFSRSISFESILAYAAIVGDFGLKAIGSIKLNVNNLRRKTENWPNFVKQYGCAEN